MIHLCDDYYMESDGVYNIVLYQKRIISANQRGGKQAKAENIGKEKYEAIGYYGTVESLLKGLCRKLTVRILADESIKDLQEASKKLLEAIESIDFSVHVDGELKSITAKNL